VSEWPMVSVL